MTKKRISNRGVGPKDRAIGENIRVKRLAKGVSQVALGKSIGVSFQQVQKIEGGINRIAASRLHDVALALDEPVQSFFEGAK